MNIYFNDCETAKIFRNTIVDVAKKLNLQDIDWKTTHELYLEIKQSGHQILNALDNYLIQHLAWIAFIQVYHYRSGYDPNEQRELNRLVKLRNTARADLKHLI